MISNAIKIKIQILNDVTLKALYSVVEVIEVMIIHVDHRSEKVSAACWRYIVLEKRMFVAIFKKVKIIGLLTRPWDKAR